MLARAVMLGLVSLPGVSAAGASPALAAPAGCPDGYRRLGALRDFALGRGWTIYASCAHPEMPRLAVADGGKAEPPRRPAGDSLDTSSRAGLPKPASSVAPRAMIQTAPAPAGSSAQPPMPVVAVGARVRLWKRDGVAAIDLPGTALESGSAGVRIRVRVAPGGKVLRGTVRGPGSVELDPRSAVPGFSGEGQ